MNPKSNTFLAVLLVVFLLLALTPSAVLPVARAEIAEQVVNGFAVIIDTNVSRVDGWFSFLFNVYMNGTVDLLNIKFFRNGSKVDVTLKASGESSFCYLATDGSYKCLPIYFRLGPDRGYLYGVNMTAGRVGIYLGSAQNVLWMSPSGFDPSVYGDELDVIVVVVTSKPVLIRVAYGEDLVVEEEQRSKPWWQRIADAVTGFFGAVIGGLKALVDALSRLGEFIWNALRFLVESIKNIGAAFGAVVEGFKQAFSFFGRPGNPAEYQRLLIESLSNQELRDALAKCPNYPNKQLCDRIASVRPEGLLGYISWLIFYASAAKDVLMWVVRNFFMVWTIIILAIVVFGMERSARTRDPEPLMQSLQIAWQVFLFPFRVIWFFIELVIKLVQAIAQFIQAIKPI